jgi:hypothetical protein
MKNRLTNFERLAVAVTRDLICNEITNAERFKSDEYNTLDIYLAEDTLYIKVKYFVRCKYEGRLQGYDTPPEPAIFEADVEEIIYKAGAIVYKVDDRKDLIDLQGIEFEH